MSLDFDGCYIGKEVGTEMKKYIVFHQVFKRKCTYLLNIFHESYFEGAKPKTLRWFFFFHTWHFGFFGFFLELPATVFVKPVAFCIW